MSRANFKITPTPSVNDLATDAVLFGDRENLGGVFNSEYDFKAVTNWLNFPYLDAEPVEINDVQIELAAPTTIFQSKSGNRLDARAIDRVEIRQPFIPISPIENVTLATSQQARGENPAFDLIGLTQLRNDPQFAGIDGSGFSVAVIDTGLDINHPLIAPNHVAGYDFVNRGNDISDRVGHGTHVSGIIAATDETIGVAPDAGLIGLKVLNRRGGASFSEVENALKWVFDNRQKHNITAVNLSLGTGFFTSADQVKGNMLSDDIERLEEVGVTVVAGAGNSYSAFENSENRANIAFPAISSTIAVGAVWQDGSKSSISWRDGSIDFSTGADRIPAFSQRLDSENFIFAPGAIITSTLPNNRIGENAGTSMASPHIAGAVALLQEASLQFSDRVLTPAEVNEILRSSGDRIFDGDDEDDSVTNTETSYIRVNVYNAVREIKRRSEAITLPTEDNLNDIIPQIKRVTSLPIRDRTEEIGRDGEAQVGEGDVDFYLFNLEESGVLEIDVDSQAANPLNSVISLFDREGRRLAVEDDNSSNDSTLRFQVDANTDYYAAITGFGNQNFDPFLGRGTGGDTGIYSLNANLLPLSSRTSLTDNTIISPAVRSVVVGQTLFGNLGNDNGFVVGDRDIDLYRFIPVTSESFKLETIQNEEFSADTYLRLFDSSGQEIAANNDISDSDRGSLIQFEAIAGEEYYIGVNGNGVASREYNPLTGANKGTGSLGDYNLRLTRNLETGFRSERENPVYRFYHRGIGANFYTASTTERDFIVNNLKQYGLRETSFESAEAEDSLTGAKSIYRFFNTGTGAHLYTISELEKEFIEDNLSNYNSEGIAYYGYENQQPETTPLYRLYNTELDIHFFTSSLAERNDLASSDNYRLEGNNGIAFYVESLADV